MAAQIIGRVKSGSGKSYEVKWDQAGRNVYVSWAGWSNVGKASSANETMNKAEAWLYNKCSQRLSSPGTFRVYASCHSGGRAVQFYL